MLIEGVKNLRSVSDIVYNHYTPKAYPPPSLIILDVKFYFILFFEFEI